MPQWTPQQQQAIFARNNTILVSAAAGSGKTAVLIERIVQLIREGAKVDRMLIVTFTKAAAAEMRQRLNRRLTKEAAAGAPGMADALDDLESTEISTIHAFCQKVLRNNFQAVGIDPMVRACDEQTRAALFSDAWIDAFDALLEEGEDAAFLDLAHAWDEAALREMTLQLYDFLMSLPEPMNWLDHAVNHVNDRPYPQHPWYRTLQRHARLEIEGIGAILMGMKKMFAEPDAVPLRQETWDSDQAAYQGLMCVDWDNAAEIIAALDRFTMVKAKAARGCDDAQKAWLDRYKKQRERIADIIKTTRKRLTIDESALERELSMMQHHLEGLAALTKRVHTVFLEKKADKHVIDFSDMEQFTMTVLSTPALRQQMQGEYDHIFVDECQDVSQIQDAILQAIHNESNCMFMVGDVKQSIYRFRKADPTLFLHRMRTFSDAEDAQCRRIFLQKNFRSRYNVLEATNQVFRVAMRPSVTELTYEKEDELDCGRATTDDPPVEVHLLDQSAGEDGEQVEALEAEAAVVVERIRALLNEQFDDGGTLRNYTYRDMVILLAAASNTAPKLVEMLGSQGIPVFYDGAAAYFSLPEIQAMKALLSIIDNPLQDVSLLAALKIAPFSLTDAELAAIRSCKTGRDVPFHEAFDLCCEGEGPLSDRCRQVRTSLNTWRFEAETMRLSDFIWHVVQDSGFYAACGALPKGELRQANLRMLFQRALTYEQQGGDTLAGFLELAEQQSSGDDRTSAKMLGEGENLVRIMTMHKSKGLEFPVVFCMQMSGHLHRAYRGDLLMHTKLGLAMPYVNSALRIKRKTIADDAFKVQRELDEKAERARLLYVAMTRARERLILIGCCKGNERDIWQMPESDYRIWTASSMTDWIMQGVYTQVIPKLSTSDAQPANLWKISTLADSGGLCVDKSVDNFSVERWILPMLSGPVPDGMEKWAMVQETPQRAPLKTSVSAVAKKTIMQDPMPLTDREEDEEVKRTPEEIVTPQRLSELPGRPAFMEEKQMTGAERGTLMHRALSLLPLAELRGAQDLHGAVHRALHQLMEREVFTPQELLIISIKGLAGFYGSDLGQRMLRSGNVRREWGFNLVMDAQQGSLLQGVIDCCFEEDGAWVLVDYKTDRISDEAAFLQRYEMQLTWYARALAAITGMPVREKWLYAIGPGTAYQLQ